MPCRSQDPKFVYYLSGEVGTLFHVTYQWEQEAPQPLDCDSSFQPAWSGQACSVMWCCLLMGVQVTLGAQTGSRAASRATAAAWLQPTD
jgi:hypothetical protein